MPKLTIIHTSDLHGHLTPSAARALRHLKTSLDAILLDSGDCSALPNILPAIVPPPVTRTMAAAGYDAVAIGNREWFFLTWGIRGFLRGLSCPVVSTNLAPHRPHGPVPMALIDAGDQRVAILAVSRKMLDPSSPFQRLCDHRWVDPLTALEEYIPRARSQAQWVIVLSHLGLSGDIAIAASADVDLILGGHDHILTPAALQSFGRPIVHSGCYARWATVITLSRDNALAPPRLTVRPVRLTPPPASAD